MGHPNRGSLTTHTTPSTSLNFDLQLADMILVNAYAPIALFVYRRIEHTRMTINALADNDLAAKTDLIVFSDGAKDTSQNREIKDVRNYLRSVTGFRSIKIVESNQNQGLASSIINGVTKTLEDYESIIVVEDDLVTSPAFLQYMNDGLNRYKNAQDVASIHGYVYPVKKQLPETFFLRGADCWGWATWRRGWRLFNPDGLSLLQELETRGLTNDFDFGGAFPYTQMLRDQIEGRNDSWAIRWYASAFLANAFTLYPGRSLVHNIGVDGSGTHCKATTKYQSLVSSTPVQVGEINVEDSKLARKAFSDFARANLSTKPSRGILSRILNRLSSKWLRHR